MLVLSRKLGEKIVIGDNIVLTVVAIKGNQIRLGVEAPRKLPVWRGELIADQPTVAHREEELVPA
jgi:carbon storage regulator